MYTYKMQKADYRRSRLALKEYRRRKWCAEHGVRMFSKGSFKLGHLFAAVGVVGLAAQVMT